MTLDKSGGMGGGGETKLNMPLTLQHFQGNSSKPHHIKASH
jgi:hypothetical protein